MSVVVKRLKSSSMEIYVKGAPEVMVDICDRDSCSSIPLLWLSGYLTFGNNISTP